MKRILASILAFVYLVVAIPAVYGQSECEGGCEEVKQVKTEEHHRTTTSFFKLEPLAPVIGVYEGLVQVDAGASSGDCGYALILSGKIPLFIRYCNFRI